MDYIEVKPTMYSRYINCVFCPGKQRTSESLHGKDLYRPGICDKCWAKGRRWKHWEEKVGKNGYKHTISHANRYLSIWTRCVNWLFRIPNA